MDDRVLGYTEAGDYIGIPGIKNNMRQDIKLTLGKTYNAGLHIENDKSLIDKNGNVILLYKEIGKVEITKVGSDWAEGTFFFTVTHCLDNLDKKIELT